MASKQFILEGALSLAFFNGLTMEVNHVQKSMLATSINAVSSGL